MRLITNGSFLAEGSQLAEGSLAEGSLAEGSLAEGSTLYLKSDNLHPVLFGSLYHVKTQTTLYVIF